MRLRIQKRARMKKITEDENGLLSEMFETLFFWQFFKVYIRYL